MDGARQLVSLRVVEVDTIPALWPLPSLLNPITEPMVQAVTCLAWRPARSPAAKRVLQILVHVAVPERASALGKTRIRKSTGTIRLPPAVVEPVPEAIILVSLCVAVRPPTEGILEVLVLVAVLECAGRILAGCRVASAFSPPILDPMLITRSDVPLRVAVSSPTKGILEILVPAAVRKCARRVLCVTAHPNIF